jgi:hypothetical protein
MFAPPRGGIRTSKCPHWLLIIPESFWITPVRGSRTEHVLVLPRVGNLLDTIAIVICTQGRGFRTARTQETTGKPWLRGEGWRLSLLWSVASTATDPNLERQMHHH